MLQLDVRLPASGPYGRGTTQALLIVRAYGLDTTDEDAQAVLDQLKSGADFNDFAALYDPNTRGELGWFPKGYLLEPKIEEAAFSLQVGEYSDVIQTNAGFHIIKVLERDAEHPLSPDAYLAMQEIALKDWVSQQRAEATIVLAP